jgi:hypothetical protein
MNRINYLSRNVLLFASLAFFGAAICIFPGPKKDTVKTIDFDSAFKTKLGDLTLAKIGDDEISVREFLCSYEYGPSFAKREKDSKARYLNYMINEKLLTREGLNKGYADSSQVKDLLAAIKSDISTEQMFEDDILKDIKIVPAELNEGILEKEITVSIKWLFAPNEDSLKFYTFAMKNGVPFDSLFNVQLKDSVFADQRSIEKDKFKFKIENPEMFSVVNSLRLGEVSNPVKGPDGWYIVKLVNTWNNIITTETMKEQEMHDVKSALTMSKSDSLSDEYVRKMMLTHNPVIQGKAFDILRSYMGRYVLNEEKFKKWKLDERMQKELKYFDSLKPLDYANLSLVVLNDRSLTLNDFISWFKMRDEYIKFNETGFNAFSASLEQIVWQMVRDNLLTKQAYDRGYQDKDIVKQQLDWWQDKIVYAVVRDEIGKSIGLNIEKPSSSKDDYNDKKQDLITRTFRKLQELKKKYSININENILNKIVVQDSNNPRAVDFYFVRKGGIFPHPVYPSIDFVWHDWE